MTSKPRPRKTSSISRRVAVRRCRRPTGWAGAPGSVTSTRSAASRVSSSAASSASLRRSTSASSALRASLAARPTVPRSSGGSCGDAAQQVRQLGLAAEVLHARRCSTSSAEAGARQRLLGLGPQLVDPVGHGHGLRHLVQGHGRGHRRVERLARVGDRQMGHAVASCHDLVRQPGPLGPDDERRGLERARAAARPAARRARSRGRGRSSTRCARATGTAKIAPIDARTALGPNGSAQPGPSATLAAPNASAPRRIVPTLPGSPTPHSATHSGPVGRVAPSAARRRRSRGCRSPATRPWRAARARPRCPSRPAAGGDEAARPARQPAASAASSRSSPSATNARRRAARASLRSSLSFSLWGLVIIGYGQKRAPRGAPAEAASAV